MQAIVVVGELKEVLKKHKLWRNGKVEGVRANLSNLNLSGICLSGYDLSYANLSNTNLTDADLTGTNLSYANLYCADLSYANVSYAKISGADLTNTRLDKALGLKFLGRERKGLYWPISSKFLITLIKKLLTIHEKGSQ